MHIEFHGGVRTVTGSAHLLRTGGQSILLECGQFQGPTWLERRNEMPFLFDPRQLDAVVVSHAHIDHIGLLPKLVKAGYAGSIHATRATAELATIMLLDAAHIQERDTAQQNRRNKRAGRPEVPPLYTTDDARAALELFVPHRYEKEFSIGSDVSVLFRDAGHILGSAFLHITVQENGSKRRLLFSGDIGSNDRAIIRDPFPPDPCDVLLIESTYGDRLHKPTPDTLNELADILHQAYRDGGNVVIPAFALGRTQQILYRLRELSDEGRLPEFEAFVDSPMAISITEIVRNNPQCYDEETIYDLTALGHDPLSVPNLHFTRQTIESMQINDVEKPSIIISASGMCNAGRILHHLKHNLWRREAHIVFVGYQARGTLGRLLVDGAPRVKIFGDEVVVAAHIHTIGGLSAHGDRDDLLNWMKPAIQKNTQVFVVHGEEDVSTAFAKTIQQQFGVKATVPTWHEIIKI